MRAAREGGADEGLERSRQQGVRRQERRPSSPGRSASTAGDELRLLVADVDEKHPFVQHELLMPVLPHGARAATRPRRSPAAKRVEHGFGHTAVMYSTQHRPPARDGARHQHVDLRQERARTWPGSASAARATPRSPSPLRRARASPPSATSRASGAARSRNTFGSSDARRSRPRAPRALLDRSRPSGRGRHVQARAGAICCAPTPSAPASSWSSSPATSAPSRKRSRPA